MYESKEQYIHKFIVDATEVRNGMEEDYEDIEKVVNDELIAYKRMYYRLFNKKPSWYGMDDIEEISAAIEKGIDEYWDDRMNYG